LALRPVGLLDRSEPVDLGSAALAVHGQECVEAALPDGGDRPPATPAQDHCSVGPLDSVCQGSRAPHAGHIGVPDELEEARLLLRRVLSLHACRFTGASRAHQV
jgi:hypothetical protein